MEDTEEWKFIDVAIMQLYSLPDLALLKLSSQTVLSCVLLPEMLVVPIKQIHMPSQWCRITLCSPLELLSQDFSWSKNQVRISLT